MPGFSGSRREADKRPTRKAELDRPGWREGSLPTPWACLREGPPATERPEVAPKTRESPRAPERPGAPPEPAGLLVVTDLDGTLLDETTYGFEAARPALAELRRRGIPVVLASSKTRAEMEPLSRRLGFRAPMIVENGGALLLPNGDEGYESVVFGLDAAVLAIALRAISREVGSPLAGFSSLTTAQVARLTGLGIGPAALARRRDYDEPFLLDDERLLARIQVSATKRGLRITRGGRFFHLTGNADKGTALRALLSRSAGTCPTPDTVGLGDAGNDLSLLQAVDRPILLPGKSGEIDTTLAATLPAAECAPLPGPAGWNAAILTVLAGGRLPSVSSSKQTRPARSTP